MRRRALTSIVVLGGALWWGSPVQATVPPIPAGLSPGGLDRFTVIGDRCPTFSWVAVPGAVSHELVVYDLDQETPASAAVGAVDDPRPVIGQSFPGSASSWTPPLLDCFDRGGDYGWSVRAHDEVGPGEWSETRFFRIAVAPSSAEVEAALEILRRHLEAGAEVGEAMPEKLAPESSTERRPATSSSRAEALAAVLTGVTAIRGETPDPSGATYGIVGVSNSPQGAGVGAENTAGGADLVLAGSPGAVLTEEGIDRISDAATSFDIRNSGAGAMRLLVDGESVVTTSIDRDTLGALSCGSGDLAKWTGAAWSCALDVDSDTTYTPGNQLTLTGGTFDVVEGSGSGLDADTVDGQDSSSFSSTVHGHGYSDLPTTIAKTDVANTFTTGTQTLRTGSAATLGLVVQGASGQNASLQEWQDSTGAFLASVSATGVISGSAFSGSGASLTSLDASSLSSGQVAPARGGLGFDASAAGTGSLLYTSGTGSWSTLGPGTNGQVLKLAAGIPAWSADSGGTVTTVASGTGLIGGPITAAGTLAIDSAVVPQLGTANTFTTGTQTLRTGSAATLGLVVQGASGQNASLQEWRDSTGAFLASVSATGVISGSGAGLTSLDASNLSSGQVAPARGGLGFDASAAGTGSLLYTSGTGSWSTLGPGTNGQVLKLAAGAPTWSADAGGTVTSVSSGTGLTGGPITTSGTLSIDTGVVPRLGSANSFTQGQSMPSASFTTTVGTPFSVASTTKVSDLNADLLDGLDSSGFATSSHSHSSGDLPSNLAFTDAANTFSNLQSMPSASFTTTVGAPFSVVSTTTVTNLNADLLDGTNASGFATSSHSHGDGDLSGNVDLLNTAQTLTGTKTFNPAVGFAPFIVSAGKTGLVTNLNADLLDGVHASALAPAAHTHSAGELPLAVAYTDGTNTFTSTQTMMPVSPASVGLVAQGASGQTADLQQWKDSSGTVRARVTASGGFTGDGSGLTGVSSSSGGMLSARVDGLPAGSATVFGAVSGISGASTIESDVTSLSTAGACEASDLALRLTVAPGTGSEWTVTLRVDGVSTGVACTVAGASTSCTSSGSEVIPAGSALAFELMSPIAAAGGASALIGWACR